MTVTREEGVSDRCYFGVTDTSKFGTNEIPETADLVTVRKSYSKKINNKINNYKLINILI